MFLSCYLYALFSSDYFYSTSQCVKDKDLYIMIETNVIFHVFMCVTQSVFMPILYLTPSTFLLFAELQSYSYC